MCGLIFINFVAFEVVMLALFYKLRFSRFRINMTGAPSLPSQWAIFNDPMFLPMLMQRQFSSSLSLSISSSSPIGSPPSSPVSISSTSSSREVLLTGFEIRGFSPSRMGHKKVVSITVQSQAS